MKKMRNFLTLAAAAALTGILLTGCSTEADETTIAKAETDVYKRQLFVFCTLLLEQIHTWHGYNTHIHSIL